MCMHDLQLSKEANGGREVADDWSVNIIYSRARRLMVAERWLKTGA